MIMLYALTLGLYAYCLSKVVRVAGSASSVPGAVDGVVLFGQRLLNGEPRHDFRSRINRAITIKSTNPLMFWILTGGARQGARSEAYVAYRDIDPCPGSWSYELDETSRNTFENLRNAKQIMLRRGISSPVILLSNRYHLARCSAMAKEHGLPHELCAAEDVASFGLWGAGRMGIEAFYLMVFHLTKPLRRLVSK